MDYQNKVLPKTYLQIKGTAMGKRLAPAYANIYMANWEQTVLPTCPQSPKCYLRFLDNIWGIWTHTTEEFKTFTDILNSHHPSIKITSETNSKEINFLDVVTFKNLDFEVTGRLSSKVYFKPTDSHNLLHQDSFHPKHTFSGIVKSQLIRFKRICSNTEDRQSATETLFGVLKKRKYPRSMLRKIKKTVFETITPPPREQTTGANTKIIPFITTYSSHSTVMGRKIKHNFQETMGDQFVNQQTKVISAFRRNPNLKDLLVRAKLPLLGTSIQTHQGLKTATNPRSKKTHTLQEGVTLNHTNCVYLIKCKRCGILYVGETKNALKTRLSHHKYNIRQKLKISTHLVQHFSLHGLQNLYLRGIEHNPLWTTSDRQKEERNWIKKLGTIYPIGLNKAYR